MANNLRQISIDEKIRYSTILRDAIINVRNIEIKIKVTIDVDYL